MCLAGQAFQAAPKSVQNAFNVIAPGIGLASKMENKLYASTIPTAGKETMDKFMPDKMRKGILANGDKTAKSTLSNPNSEIDQKVNEANNAAISFRQQQAYAAQYNNQASFI